MVTLGGIIVVAALYSTGWYRLDFWFVVAAIIYCALGTVRAIVDPNRYWRFRYKQGGESYYPYIVLADKHHKAMTQLCITKGIVLSIMGVVAWYLGTKAGYFSH